jgi:hypothetical protein
MMAWKRSLPQRQEALKRWTLAFITMGLLMHPLAAESVIVTSNALRLQAAADFAVCGYPDTRGRFDTKLSGHDLGVYQATITRDPATQKPGFLTGDIDHIIDNWFDDDFHYDMPIQNGMLQKPDLHISYHGIKQVVDLLPLEVIDSLKFKVKLPGLGETEVNLKPDQLVQAAADLQDFFGRYDWEGQAAALVFQIAMTAITPNYCDQFHWTAHTSEELPDIWCAEDEGAIGFGCTGSYCDNVKLACARVPRWTSIDYSTWHWTGKFSEEGDSQRLCDSGNGMVIALSCTGRYCDNIDLACAQPAWGRMTHCSDWSPSLSEESGGVYNFGPGNVITGVKCQGSYCDNKQFRVCSLEKDPNVKEFEKPTIGGYRLDYCREWGTNCGAPAADAFCSSKGYTRSVHWEIDPNIGVETPTKIFATGAMCNQSFCDGFKVIDCQ